MSLSEVKRKDCHLPRLVSLPPEILQEPEGVLNFVGINLATAPLSWLGIFSHVVVNEKEIHHYAFHIWVRVHLFVVLKFGVNWFDQRGDLRSHAPLRPGLWKRARKERG